MPSHVNNVPLVAPPCPSLMEGNFPRCVRLLRKCQDPVPDFLSPLQSDYPWTEKLALGEAVREEREALWAGSSCVSTKIWWERGGVG